MSDSEIEQLIEGVLDRRIAALEKALAYLTEQRDNELLKIADVVKILQVTDRTIRTWVKEKKLRCHWLGDRQFFKMKDILAAMKTNF